MLERTGECHQCGECCERVHMTVVRDVTLRQHGNVVELEKYLSYRGIRLVGEDAANNFLFYALDVPCDKLMENKRCAVHGTPDKPLLCEKYPWEPDDIPECGYAFQHTSTLERAAS